MQYKDKFYESYIILFFFEICTTDFKTDTIFKIDTVQLYFIRFIHMMKIYNSCGTLVIVKIHQTSIILLINDRCTYLQLQYTYFEIS